MDLYDINSQQELMLRIRANEMHIPLGGSMELTPLCNMDCRMCYVRLSKNEMMERGELLTKKEWLRIAKEGFSEGLLFLLLTGGEPLLYPDFDELFTQLSKMGFVISVNTNGTLIDRGRAKLFAEHGVRRLNITLYGPDNETYSNLCKNPDGFTQVIHAAELLKKYNVPFRFTTSLTPQNIDTLPELFRVSKEMDVHLEPCSYMFPAIRRGGSPGVQDRLSPEMAAESVMQKYLLEHPGVPLSLACKQTIESSKNRPRKISEKNGFSCQAGRSGFWINWRGEMSACGIFHEAFISLTDHSFKECWSYIVSESGKMDNCSDCMDCEWQNLCMTCPAACYSETGSTSGKPEYLCHMTKEWVRLMEENIQGA